MEEAIEPKHVFRVRFDGWQYRLIHWFWKISPSCPEESKLSRTLYTRYCPLFWLTVLLCIAAPFVFAYRLLVTGAAKVATAVAKLMAFVTTWRQKLAEARQSSEAYRRASHIARLMDMIKYDLSFEHCWDVLTTLKTALTREEALQIYTDAVERAAAEKQRREEWAKRHQANITRIVLYTSAAFKILLYAVLFTASVAGAWAFFTFGVPALVMLAKMTWEVIVYLVTLQWINYLYFVLSVVGGVVMAILLCKGAVVALRYPAVNDAALSAGEKARATAHIVNGVLATAGIAVHHFFSMLYAENCPSIDLVMPEREKSE